MHWSSRRNSRKWLHLASILKQFSHGSATTCLCRRTPTQLTLALSSRPVGGGGAWCSRRPHPGCQAAPESWGSSCWCHPGTTSVCLHWSYIHPATKSRQTHSFKKNCSAQDFASSWLLSTRLWAGRFQICGFYNVGEIKCRFWNSTSRYDTVRKSHITTCLNHQVIVFIYFIFTNILSSY